MEQKCSETQFYFLLQILPPEFVVTHKADVILKMQNCKTHTKKSASFKNMVALSSYLLVENMCVLNTNYLFQFSIFLGEQNLPGPAAQLNKMVSQKDSQHLGTSCWCDFCQLLFNPLNPEWDVENSGILLLLHIPVSLKLPQLGAGL